MVRLLSGVFCFVAALFLMANTDVAHAQKKNQMVTGTIKSVDLEKSVLIINQKVKNEKVDRELSITEDVEFEVNGKTVTGSKGMELIKNRVNANVKVKCDKDVNVLKVTVMGK